MKVIDNFLPEKEFESIHSLLMGYQFPWYYNSIVDYENQIFDIFDLDNYQFINNLNEDSPVVQPILKKLKTDKIVRIKANLNPRTPEVIRRKFHIDTAEKCKTSVFYINTNNGWTEFEDGSKVESVGNRMVIFDSHIKHTGTTCTNQKTRVVINFNYYVG